MASITPQKPHSNKSGLSGTTIAIIVVAGIVLIIGGLLIGTLTPKLFPVQASAESQQIDNLFHILLVIGGVVFLLVQGLLVYSIWRFRAKPGDTADGLNMHGNTTLEIVWTAIPAVIVFVLTVLSWQVFNTIMLPKDGEMTIVANGARFNWNFEYEMPLSIMGKDYDVSKLPPPVQADLADDGLLTLTSATLYVTKDLPVVMEMEPVDVIHAFWIPAFRVKQDLIPGRITTVRFTPSETGEYLIECAELCGANHGAMRAPVIVVANETELDAALMPIMQKIVEPPDDPAERGRIILADNTYPCFTCHNLADLAASNWVGNVGPALNGVADRAATSRSAVTGETPQEYLYNSIHNPTDYLVPGYGPLMPVLNIPECQVWDIVAYLATQSETGEPPFEVVPPEQCVVAGPPPGAEATPEVGAEATAEVTGEATAEATSDNPVGEEAIEQIGGAPVTSPVAPTAEASAEVTDEPTAIPATVAP
ncbi:MAG: cytochrome c oxidase subunit II [Chloroflexi bacterium]|nr:cytochrome c oxidase subunit II [Chloroflexota bacterium]MCC6892074.1 cytochrome c oxidase subunit II [Anaerolineae bacterium]